MLKILHIIPSLSKGGAERLALTICKELQLRNGIDVRLVTLTHANEYAKEMGVIQYDFVPAVFIPSFTKKAKRNVLQLQKYIDEFAPDVIHTHLWQTEMVCSQIKYPQALWVTHMHDNMPQLKRIRIPRTKQELTNAYERWIVTSAYKKRNSKFIAISNDTLAYCKRYIPNKLRNSITLLHNAINTKLFANLNKTVQFGAVINLVSVGSLVDKKNQKFLVPVVKYLIQKGYTVSLNILGEGKNRIIIEQEITREHLHDSVHLLGNISVIENYAYADIYVHAAKYEPFGLVLIEAMAAGLPVVCLDGKGNRDLIDQGKNGYMVFDQNTELFAEKIIEIWNNKVLYKSMSEYAVEYAKQYDIVPYVDKLLQIYSIQ